MMPLTTLLASGMKGEPMPYLLRSDWFITGILFTGHNTKCDTSIMQAENLFALFISELGRKYDLAA